jgi:hypothetical protein
MTDTPLIAIEPGQMLNWAIFRGISACQSLHLRRGCHGDYLAVGTIVYTGDFKMILRRADR